MGSSKEDQTARRKAMQDVIAANRSLFEERMRHHYAEMNLGEWKPRLTAEERAERKAEEARLAATEKIQALAEKHGLAVTVDNFPEPEVETAWVGDKHGFADESIADLVAREAEEVERQEVFDDEIAVIKQVITND